MSATVASVTKSITDKHPLQRLQSPSRQVSAFVHILGLLCFAASFKYLVDYPNPANDAWGWHFIYLTIVGLTLTSLTFAVGLAADLTLSPRIFLLKNALSFCSTPLELVISILYWSLRMIDRKLVLPEWADLSQWADLGFHAVPAIMLTIDLLFLSPPWTLGVVPAFGVSVGLAMGYWYWVEQCYSHNGWYPYPLFDVLTTSNRVALFVGSAVVMALNASLLTFVYSQLNGRELSKMKAPRNKPGALKR